MTRVLRRLAAVGASIAMVLTLVATHFPPPSAVGTSDADPDRQAVWGVWHTMGELAHRLPDLPGFLSPLRSDKTLHFFLFFFPAVLWSLAAGKRLTGRWGAALMAALSTWSAADELAQHFTGRDGQWGDWLANVAGSLVGIGVVYPVMRWRKQRSDQSAAGRGA